MNGSAEMLDDGTVTGFRLLRGTGLLLAARVNDEARKIVTQLGLAPLPEEGGFFRRTWTSEAKLASGRAASSAIWFLLTPDNFSAWHRLQSEELWHFHAGDPVEHVRLDPVTRMLDVTVMGGDIASGQRPGVRVPGRVWQGARVMAGARQNGWSLFGCTVTPAWDQAEFELAARAELRRGFPGAAEWIEALTR